MMFSENSTLSVIMHDDSLFTAGEIGMSSHSVEFVLSDCDHQLDLPETQPKLPLLATTRVVREPDPLCVCVRDTAQAPTELVLPLNSCSH